MLKRSDVFIHACSSHGAMLTSRVEFNSEQLLHATHRSLPSSMQSAWCDGRVNTSRETQAIKPVDAIVSFRCNALDKDVAASSAY